MNLSKLKKMNTQKNKRRYYKDNYTNADLNDKAFKLHSINKRKSFLLNHHLITNKQQRTKLIIV